jgi:hypothetical protein
MVKTMTAEADQQAGTPPDEDRYCHKGGERLYRVSELYSVVLVLAAERRLQVIHGLPRSMLAIGWPDLVVIGPGGTLFRKLLDEHGEPGGHSAIMLDCLYRSYADAGIWRPQDLHDGTIEAQLDRICGESGVAYLTCQECGQPVPRMGRYQKHCDSCAATVKRRQTLASWHRAQARKAAQGE